MARKVSKAGKGGGDALAALNDFVNTFDNIKRENAEGAVTVSVAQKQWNTYSQSMKTEIGKSYVKMSAQIEAQTLGAIRYNLSNSLWGWPRETRRYNGQVVGAPRDIIDSGKLLSKTKITSRFTQKSITIKHYNTAPYAGIVHYGGYVRRLNGARVFMPARPWASVVWDRVPPKSVSYSGVAKVNVRTIILDELRAALTRATPGR